MIFEHFIRRNYSKLVKGEEVLLPAGFKNLSQFGFKEEYIAQPVGQIKNYVLSNSNGSRYHVHEFEDGRQVIHLDKYDPNKDLPNLIKHLFKETWIAPAICLFFGLILLTRAE